ncbi:MAG: cytochrome c biogenesis protein CcsA [Planctomycetes bacterium]|nr:cytochrome c biogenesis protein CcsA [Planctomycetota bacterium]MBI3834021.1 cytochrome c biogenesis protein CcsA [Planctomycetota bacterium]
MKWLSRIRLIDGMVITAIVLVCSLMPHGSSTSSTSKPSEFAGKVDLDPLYRTAVQADGRLRSFESHAKTFIAGYITGARSVHGQTNGFTYLDMMFRPETYAGEELVYVKNKEVRKQILDAGATFPGLDKATHDRLMEQGLFPRTLLSYRPVNELLQRLERDLIRTAKVVDAIRGAMSVCEPRVLSSNLRMIAPPDGDVHHPWFTFDELSGTARAPSDNMHSNVTAAAPAEIPGLAAESQKKLVDAWTGLRKGWQAQDAAAVNQQIAALADILPTIGTTLYPSPGRLATESWYFRYQSMTWVWLIYLLAVIPLLMSVIYKWERARTIGMIMFGLAFLAHTTAIGIRWYISGRWPNANMFEALTTSAWFGGLGAMILEWAARRSALRNLFALGSAVTSMVALMAAYFLPAQLDSAINNKMAALNDIWLYIHTNMIIWSYAVIGLACVPAVLQLRHRWCQLWDSRSIAKARLILLPISLGVFNYTAYLLLMHAIAHDSPDFALPGRKLMAVGAGFWASLVLIAMEAFDARARRRVSGLTERFASGGAASMMGGSASMMMGQQSGGSFLRPEGPTVGQVFDGATMVLVELAFIMLWTGTVMGAIWADHSWGRPWGWDPKEVFALNTFLIFLILIHVRLKVKDKAFWTAVLAIVGYEVMLFNWIVVNFIISGLHSYA